MTMKTREMKTKEIVTTPPAKPEVFPCPKCLVPTMLTPNGVNRCPKCGGAFQKREVDVDVIDAIFTKLEELGDDAELFVKQAWGICKGLLSRTQIERAIKHGDLKRRRGVITVKALREYLESRLGGVVEEK